MSGIAGSTPRCEICGLAWSPDGARDTWLGAEIDHAGGRIHAAFCSREHAGQFFERPLPAAPPRDPPPMATGERAMIAAVSGLAVVAFGVLVVGLVVIVQDVVAWL